MRKMLAHKILVISMKLVKNGNTRNIAISRRHGIISPGIISRVRISLAILNYGRRDDFIYSFD